MIAPSPEAATSAAAATFPRFAPKGFYRVILSVNVAQFSGAGEKLNAFDQGSMRFIIKRRITSQKGGEEVS
jgi:hypothetical protein